MEQSAKIEDKTVHIYTVEVAQSEERFVQSLSNRGLNEPIGYTAPVQPSPPVPKDKFFIIWLAFILNSGGFWLAWNLMNFLGPTYYFDYWFSTWFHVPTKYATDFLNALGMLACSPLFAMGYVALIPIIWIPLVFRYVAALMVYLICMIILLIATFTWKSTHLNQGPFFTFSVTVILIMMGAIAVYQSYLYGMAADLPRIYTSAIVIGTNAGGIFASLLYVICTKSSPKDLFHTELQTAEVFYSVTVAYLALCVASVYLFWKSDFYQYFSQIGEQRRNEVSCDPRKFFREFGEIFCTAWCELLGIFMIFFTMYCIFPTLSVGIEPWPPKGQAHLPKYFLPIGTFLNFYTLATIGAIVAMFIDYPTHSKKLRIFLLVPCYFSMYLIAYFMFCNFYPNEPKERSPTSKVIFKNEWFYFIGNGFLGVLTGFLSGILMPLASRVVRPELRRLAAQMALASLLTGLYLGAGMTPGFIQALTVNKS